MIQKIKTRRAFTMVELLIVVAIAMLLIAIAIPFIRPGIETSRLREATRQVNTFILGAKARAADTGRPFGVRLMRSSVDGTGDPNDCYRMQYVEVPPPYSGDLDNSTITVGPREPGVSSLVTADPSVNPYAGWLNASYLDASGAPVPYCFSAWLNPAQATSSSLLAAAADEFRVKPGDSSPRDAWIRANRVAPFAPGDTIRFGFQGSMYLIIDLYVDTATSRPMLTLAPVVGAIASNSAIPAWPQNPALGLNKPFSNAIPEALRTKPYQIFPKPRVAGNSTLELPRNTSIDLAFSGVGGAPDQEFFAGPNPANISDAAYVDTTPIDIVFAPSGQMVNVGIGGAMQQVSASVYLLIGRTERVAPVNGVGSRAAMPLGNELANDPINPSNLQSNDSLWVAVQYPTGAVLTAENLGSEAPILDLSYARDLVRSGVAKGSR